MSKTRGKTIVTKASYIVTKKSFFSQPTKIAEKKFSIYLRKKRAVTNLYNVSNCTLNPFNDVGAKMLGGKKESWKKILLAFYIISYITFNYMLDNIYNKKIIFSNSLIFFAYSGQFARFFNNLLFQIRIWNWYFLV